MELLGVECKIIMGSSKKSFEKHVWNMVKLDDGNWYYVDLTWDETEEPGKVLYDYFNVSYQMIANDHEFEEWQQLEEATSTKYNLYSDCIAYCTQDVVDILKDQFEAGKLEGEIYINYRTDVNETMPLVLQAMKESEVYGKVRLDKKTEKIYSYNIYE